LRELDLLAGDAVDDRQGIDLSIKGLVERCAIHRTVQIGQVLRPIADQGANLVTAIKRQCETLKLLGAVDRVKHSRPADVLRAAQRFQVAENGDQVRQVRLVRVRNLLDPDTEQEIGHLLELFIHRLHLICSSDRGRLTRPRTASRQRRE
jgi:hypothetical protein